MNRFILWNLWWFVYGRKEFLFNFSSANLLFHAFEYRSHDVKFDWIPNWPFLTSNLTEVDLPFYRIWTKFDFLWIEFGPNLIFIGSNLDRIWFSLDRIWFSLDRIRFSLDRFLEKFNRISIEFRLKLSRILHSSFKIIRSPLPNRVEFLIEFFLPNLTEHLETVPYIIYFSLYLYCLTTQYCEKYKMIGISKIILQAFISMLHFFLTQFIAQYDHPMWRFKRKPRKIQNCKYHKVSN